jgi:hypothetical protein
MRAILVRLLVRSVIATLLLPMVVVLLVGLGAVLDGLGDQWAAAACRRAGLLTGIVWGVAVIATSVCGGLVAVDMAGQSSASAGRLRQPDEPHA